MDVAIMVLIVNDGCMRMDWKIGRYWEPIIINIFPILVLNASVGGKH
jgi:hypothetical protein